MDFPPVPQSDIERQSAVKGKRRVNTEMQNQEVVKAVKFTCPNCKRDDVAWQGKDGMTRFQCPRCGTVTVAKPMSRRHVQLDIYAPKGQVLVENYN